MSAPAPHLGDEQLSAVVDGMGSLDDQAHVDQCDQCRARLASWRRVIGQVSAAGYPAPSQAARDDAVRAALGSAQPGPVAALRLRRWGGNRVAALAAAVLVVSGLAVGVDQVANGSGHHPSQSASRAASSTTRPEPAQARPVNGGSGGVGGGASRSGVGVGATVTPSAYLGSFSNSQALVAALRRQANFSPQSSLSTVPTGTDRCAVKSASDAVGAAGGTLVYRAALNYQGRSAQVSVFQERSGKTAVVESQDGCALLAKVAFS